MWWLLVILVVWFFISMVPGIGFVVVRAELAPVPTPAD
jgi:hypothetical protein